MLYKHQPCPALNGKFGLEFAIFCGYVEGAVAARFEDMCQDDTKSELIYEHVAANCAGEANALAAIKAKVDFYLAANPESYHLNDHNIGHNGAFIRTYSYPMLHDFVAKFELICPGCDPVVAWLDDQSENPHLQSANP